MAFVAEPGDLYFPGFCMGMLADVLQLCSIQAPNNHSGSHFAAQPLYRRHLLYPCNNPLKPTKGGWLCERFLGMAFDSTRLYQAHLQVLVAGQVQVRQLPGGCQGRGNAAEAVALQVQHLQRPQIAPLGQTLRSPNHQSECWALRSMHETLLVLLDKHAAVG